MKKHIIVSIIVLLINLKLFGQSSSNKAFNDFTNPLEFSAFNEEIIFNIKGDSIAGYAFIAKGRNHKETVIMLHGLPGNDNQFDIANSIRRTGRNVIYFNYRGSWGSQGDFLYSNSLEDVYGVIEHLSSLKNSTRLRIDTNAFVILGRSYGGGIALIEGSKNERIKKIIAISSMNAGSRFNPIQKLSELKGWKDYLNRQVMLNVNPNIFLQEMLDNKEKYNVVTYKNQLKNKKVLFIESSKNNQSWIGLLKNIDYKIMKSDHNFISNRIELTTVIVNWLNNN
jgi:predicted alpha/beta-fold hydrolase